MNHIELDLLGRRFHAVANGAGEVVYATFGELDADEIVGALTPAPSDHPVAVALRRYAAGDLQAIDSVPVAQEGTDFRRQVWETMRQVPAGETISYTELADRVGRPKAVRTVASGCASNHVLLFVPCHRIVRADKTIGKYACGTEIKALLLDHERAHKGD